MFPRVRFLTATRDESLWAVSVCIVSHSKQLLGTMEVLHVFVVAIISKDAISPVSCAGLPMSSSSVEKCYLLKYESR